MNLSSNLVYFIPHLTVGGLERILTELAIRLNGGPYRPIVLYSGEWGNCGEELADAGVATEKISLDGNNMNCLGPVITRLRELRPFLFHSFNYDRHACDAVAAIAAGAKALMLTRADMRHWDALKRVQDWELLRNELNDYIVPKCAAVARCCAEIENVPVERIRVIKGGVLLPEMRRDTNFREEMQFPSDALVIGCVGNLGAVKGHGVLLQAMKLVKEAEPGVRLVICGNDYGRREWLEEVIQLLQIGDVVQLTGSREDIPDVCRALDLYVHSSHMEAFPQAILEAMSHGLPIVSTSVGGVPEMIRSEETGILVEPNNPERLAEAMIRCLKSPELRRRLGTNARLECAKYYNFDRLADEYLNLYHEADSHAPRCLSHNSAGAAAGVPAARVSRDDVTVFVTTIGDRPNFTECLQRLRRQTIEVRIEIIDHVAPMSSAFQAMLDRCGTEYYVQVDEDMLLNEFALERLVNAISEADSRTGIVCGPLWDCDVEQAIYGVKIYRHSIVRHFPYRNTFSCEISQLAELQRAGFNAVILPPAARDQCFGEHGKHYTPATIFARWRRLFQKHRRYHNLGWIEPWPRRLLARFLETREELHLYAFLGAVAGLTAGLGAEGEADWRESSPEFDRLEKYISRDGQVKLTHVPNFWRPKRNMKL